MLIYVFWGEKNVYPKCDYLMFFGFFCIFFQQNFTNAEKDEATRCDTRDKLIMKGCVQSEIISPVNSHTIAKEIPLSESFVHQEPVQLSPQAISLKLRPGKYNQLTTGTQYSLMWDIE